MHITSHFLRRCPRFHQTNRRSVQSSRIRSYAFANHAVLLTFWDARSSRIILTPSQIANTYLRDPPGRISEQVSRVMTRVREINVKIVYEIPDTRDPRDSSLHGPEVTRLQVLSFLSSTPCLAARSFSTTIQRP